MQSPHIAARIKEVTPVAQYQGKTIDQSVTIKFADPIDGSIEELDLFDDACRVSGDEVDSHLSLVVSALPSTDIHLTNENTPSVQKPKSPSSEWSYRFSGEITSIRQDEWYGGSYDQLYVLDIGAGELLIPPNSALNQFMENNRLSVGNFLSFTASRTDIVGVME